MVTVEHRNRPTNTLSAKSIKVTLVLTPTEVLTLTAPDGQPRCIVRVAVSGKTITADLNAKSVRKAITTIKENGAEACACILQGKLEANDTLADAGLSVQLKTKPAAALPSPK